MNRRISLRPGVALAKFASGLLAAMAITGAPASAAWAEVGPAQRILNAMSDYVSRQYTLRLREWETGVSPASDAFAFKPPEGSGGVAISLLMDMDEAPAGVVSGGVK